jgi:hypothetical protein
MTSRFHLKIARVLGIVHMHGRGLTLRVMVASRLKISC